MPIVIEDLNLRDAERQLCVHALETAGTIVDAAQMLGITRHALKRRIIKHAIEWPSRELGGLSGGAAGEGYDARGLGLS